MGARGSSSRYQAIAESITSTWESGSRPWVAVIVSRIPAGSCHQQSGHAKWYGSTGRRHPPAQAWVALAAVTTML